MAVTTQITQTPVFVMPLKIVSNGLLRTLSGDALSMFLLIASKLHQRKTPEIFVSDFEMLMSINVSPDMVRATRIELAANHLIEYQLCRMGSRYWFAVDENR
jgi:hypothetical protein